MKKWLIGLCILAAMAAGGWLVYSLYSRTPQALLRRLASGRGDREQAIMQLNVARGDVISPMIQTVLDRSAAPAFRCDVLELLFKRNSRAAEERIEQAIIKAMKEPEVLLRRKAVAGLVMYGEPKFQVSMIDCLTDPDAQVRRQAYTAFCGPAGWRDPGEGIWELLSAAQHEHLVKTAQQAVAKEGSPEMKLLAKAVLGREIEILGVDATQAVQTSDVPKAQKLLERALALDEENCQAQIRLARFHYRHGQAQDGIDLARKHKCLIEVPALSAEPEIDGDPQDKVWSEACAITRFFKTDARWTPLPAAGKSKAMLGHRNGVLYIAVIGYEDDLDKLVVKNTERDSDVWADDCVELMFDPAMGEKDIYQFAINPAGALFDMANFNSKRNFKCQYKAAVFKDRGYWACEFAIEGKELGNATIAPGTFWSLDIFRSRVGMGSEQQAVWPTFGQCQRTDIYPLVMFK